MRYTMTAVALAAAWTASAVPAAAQSACQQFADAMAKKNAAYESGLDRLKSSQPAGAACRTARQLLQAANATEAEGKATGVCAGMAQNDFGRLKLKFETASAGFNARMIEPEVGRLCR